MASSTVFVANPTADGERIVLLDSLRGIAVLGILMMNIPGFGMPVIAHFHPTMTANFTGINFYTWYGVEWVLEGSQRALFSMLFGAGMLLFISRLEDRSKALMPAEYYFRRQLWLLLFGFFNAYVLLWFWDILYHYALFGMLLFVFRRLKPKHLFLAAGICLVLHTVRENVDFYRDKNVILQGEILSKTDTTQTPLTAFQKDDLAAFQGLKQASSLEAKTKRMEKALRNVQGPYSRLYEQHSDQSMRGETEGVFHFLFFDVLLFMFLGMAFYKTGILTGQHSVKTYWLLFVIGLGTGLLISHFRLQAQLAHQFDYYAIAKNESFMFYEISRTLRALGIFGGIMLLYKSGVFGWLFSLMRPVGQMAFTNYLMQSLMCGLFFYGVGFGWYGKLEIHQLYFVVAAVWVVEIIWSHLWLSRFRYGPMEWLWRSLTYWKKQPILKTVNLPTVKGKEEKEPVAV